MEGSLVGVHNAFWHIVFEEPEESTAAPHLTDDGGFGLLPPPSQVFGSHPLHLMGNSSPATELHACSSVRPIVSRSQAIRFPHVKPSASEFQTSSVQVLQLQKVFAIDALVGKGVG